MKTPTRNISYPNAIQLLDLPNQFEIRHLLTITTNISPLILIEYHPYHEHNNLPNIPTSLFAPSHTKSNTYKVDFTIPIILAKNSPLKLIT